MYGCKSRGLGPGANHHLVASSRSCTSGSPWQRKTRAECLYTTSFSAPARWDDHVRWMDLSQLLLTPPLTVHNMSLKAGRFNSLHASYLSKGFSLTIGSEMMMSFHSPATIWYLLKNLQRVPHPSASNMSFMFSLTSLSGERWAFGSFNRASSCCDKVRSFVIDDSSGSGEVPNSQKKMFCRITPS